MEKYNTYIYICIGPVKFSVADKRFGECPSERENERFENGDPKTVFDVYSTDRSRQEPGESINASTASRVYYVFMRAAIYPLVGT